MVGALLEVGGKLAELGEVDNVNVGRTVVVGDALGAILVVGPALGTVLAVGTKLILG